MKDLSKYIESLIVDIKLDAECKVSYIRKDHYAINIRVKDIRYHNNFVRLHVKEWILSIINDYFPKGNITCVINVKVIY
jgi:hypothetical protein